MKITRVEPGSIAEELGIEPGDVLLEVNDRRVQDQIDFRFYETDDSISLKVAKNGEVVIFDIEKEEGGRVGIDFEEMKILACGNDCIFCFVDQNPEGLRKELYFRDGDYRLSFMYGNYTTMTNAGPAILDRIIKQRLSPQYISVHTTEYAVRKLLMGLKKDDHILDKIRLLHDNGIDMHTQIVLCPGLNDGESLVKTVFDLYEFRKHIISLAIVPVGLTDHRFGLWNLKKVDAAYASALLDMVASWQKRFRSETRRNFVYPSDEFFILADRKIPTVAYYDGFPQTENGVGMVRGFLVEFNRQARRFPKRLRKKRKITLVTAELPARIIREKVVPALEAVAGLEVALHVVPNLLYGRSVTVAGLLSGKCLLSALKGEDCGDLLLLPPDILNTSGVFLDDTTLEDLEQSLNAPLMMFDGRWEDVFNALIAGKRKMLAADLLPVLNPHLSVP